MRFSSKQRALGVVGLQQDVRIGEIASPYVCAYVL